MALNQKIERPSVKNQSKEQHSAILDINNVLNFSCTLPKEQQEVSQLAITDIICQELATSNPTAWEQARENLSIVHYVPPRKPIKALKQENL